MGYKLSKYNINTNDMDGSLLLGNLLSNQFVKISREDIHKFNNLQNSKLLSENDLEGLGWMISKGFVVKEDVDEYSKATLKYYESIFSNDLLDITIIPTDDCNFKCIYCYQENRISKYMSDEVMDGILLYIKKNASRYKAVRINWFGGEPLMAKDTVISFMQRCKSVCKELKKPLTGAISTNGYNLDIDTFTELLKSNICFYQITIDGTEKNHNIFRPHIKENDSYKTIISNLRNISDNVKKYYKINIRVNATKSIVKEFDYFLQSLDFLKSNNNFRVNWQKMSDYGGSQIDLLRDEIIEDTQYFNILDEFTKNQIAFLNEVFLGVAAGVCSASRKNSFYIDPEGKVYKCSLAIYDENNSDYNNVSQIDKNGIIEFDEEKLSRWLIRDDTGQACKTCSSYPICCNQYCQYRRKFVLNKKLCYQYKNYLPYYIRNMSMQGLIQEVKL